MIYAALRASMIYQACGLDKQKENFCLPKVPFLFIQAAVGVPRSELAELWGFPQAWHIIDARSAAYIIKGGTPPLYLIMRQRAFSLRLDDIQGLRLDDIHAYGVIWHDGLDISTILCYTNSRKAVAL